MPQAGGDAGLCVRNTMFLLVRAGCGAARRATRGWGWIDATRASSARPSTRTRGEPLGFSLRFSRPGSAAGLLAHRRGQLEARADAELVVGAAQVALARLIGDEQGLYYLPV